VAQVAQVAPQAVGSVATSAQRPPHSASGGAQAQPPDRQAWSARQATAQAPQWAGSVASA
jgi:hypothetical protein